MRILSLFMLVLLGFATPVMAEDADKPKPDTPITRWLAAESEVVKGLDDAQKDTYFILRNKYGLIRAIRIVKRDVGNAIQECGQANPDLQDPMTKRYKSWTESVDPILKTADAFLEQEIKEQKVVSQDTFQKMLDMNDEAYDFQQDAIEKTVVTTPEACNKLLKSMDETEEDMLRLMQGVLLPEHLIRETPKN